MSCKPRVGAQVPPFKLADGELKVIRPANNVCNPPGVQQPSADVFTRCPDPRLEIGPNLKLKM